MFKKKEILDKIIQILSTLRYEIKSKARVNLLDDNTLSEDFLKDLLNECMDWNLINLNSEHSNYPAIDLGDRERHIGVQITSTNSSSKITDTLEKIVKHEIDKEFSEIYFFIISERLKNRYSIDFSGYETIDCCDDNIWDWDSIIRVCKSFDTEKLKKVYEILCRHLVSSDWTNDSRILGEGRKSAIELKECIKQIMTITDGVLSTESVTPFNMNQICRVKDIVDTLLEFMDEQTYIGCKDILNQCAVICLL